jgi:TM2 domain-containing membrane protein YozV
MSAPEPTDRGQDPEPERVPAPEPAASFAPPTVDPPHFTATAPAQAAPVAAGTFCRACGNGIDQRAVICPQCGVATGQQAAVAAPVVVSGAKSGGIAVLLSVLITGAGHWYAGEVGRGFAFFAGAFLAALSTLFLVGFIALPVVWIWAAIDANKAAERHNLRIAAAASQQPLLIAH